MLGALLGILGALVFQPVGQLLGTLVNPLAAVLTSVANLLFAL